MLIEHAFRDRRRTPMSIENARVVGKVARRTLLPDHPIPAMRVDEAEACRAGQPTQLVFRRAGS